MLKIFFELETEDDLITPLTVSNALIESSELELGDLDEIANHLLIYVNRCHRKIEEATRNIEEYRRTHGLE